MQSNNVMKHSQTYTDRRLTIIKMITFEKQQTKRPKDSQENERTKTKNDKFANRFSPQSRRRRKKKAQRNIWNEYLVKRRKEIYAKTEEIDEEKEIRARSEYAN